MKTSLFFKKLFINSTRQAKQEVKKVLILYEEKIIFLGDCCMRFDKFKYFKTLLNNASIHINFSNLQNQSISKALLKNNPNVDEVSLLDNWNEIDFKKYDVVFCVSYKEDKILEFLEGKYGQDVLSEDFNLVVYSISDLLLKREDGAKYIFPANRELNLMLKEPMPGELYVSESELDWGNRWLEQHGVKPRDRVFIMLDSTSIRGKLMKIEVYFELLNLLLESEHDKILSFDENSIGKEDFYRTWLSKEKADKIIFSKGLTLREVFCLISSSYVKLIFGPCTGLMHCSSGIYNAFVNKGLAPLKAPLMIVYAGKHGVPGYDVNLWWSNAPLINCLVVRNGKAKRELTLLSELNDQERLSNNYLSCTDFTAQMFKEFISKELSSRISTI